MTGVMQALPVADMPGRQVMETREDMVTPLHVRAG
jgi:hypothetical protein